MGILTGWLEVRLQSLGYHFDHLYFRIEDNTLVDTFEFGGQDTFEYSTSTVSASGPFA
jgi:hypothetical protein